MLNFKTLLLPAVLFSLVGGCAQEPADAHETLAGAGWSIDPGADMNDFFNCLEASGLTLVSAHRGGPAPGLPENAIETMGALMQTVPAIMEVDVATSADGVLFLMHDDDLDRTTTGSGSVQDLDWAQISGLKLEDNDGARTSFPPPRFSDALAWAKTRTIMQIDFKRATRYEDVIDEIYRQGAEDRVILIAYTLASAGKLHRLAPDMMISLAVDSQTDLNRAVAAGVPTDRLIGFTGTEAPRPRLFNLLENQEVEAIFGTLGGRSSIDAEIARSGDEARYAALAEAGVDIIATDRPARAYAALKEAGKAPRNGQCGVRRGS